MHRLTIKTHRKREIVDITDQVEAHLRKHYTRRAGACHLLVLHTTAALTTADLDPGTDADMLDAFERIIPKLNYRHPHDPEHVPDHILSTVIGTSLTLLAKMALSSSVPGSVKFWLSLTARDSAKSP